MPVAKIDRLKKLGLGTVQWGMDYGSITNARQTPQSVVRGILNHANKSGISILDTAPLYGDAEIVVGRNILPDSSFRIVTKTPGFGEKPNPAIARETLLRSLDRLRIPHIYGLIVHHCKDLLTEDGDKLWDSLVNLRNEGLVKKIGVSAYTPDQINVVADRYAIDLVQAPLSIIDQRLVTTGTLDRLKREGIEFHARSIFLQGLLLTDPNSLSEYFAPFLDHLKAYWDNLSKLDISPLQAALAYPLTLRNVDTVLCGVNSLEQLKDIVSAASIDLDISSISGFSYDDPYLLNPSLWQIK